MRTSSAKGGFGRGDRILLGSDYAPTGQSTSHAVGYA